MLYKSIGKKKQISKEEEWLVPIVSKSSFTGKGLGWLSHRNRTRRTIGQEHVEYEMGVVWLTGSSF